MKTANALDGSSIVASPTAPKQAICPSCGGPLTLRSRRTMNNGKATFFWRHRGNRNSDCTARRRPMG